MIPCVWSPVLAFGQKDKRLLDTFRNATLQTGIECIPAEHREDLDLICKRTASLGTVGLAHRFEARETADRFPRAAFNMVDIVVMDEAQSRLAVSNIAVVGGGGVSNAFCRMVSASYNRNAFHQRRGKGRMVYKHAQREWYVPPSANSRAISTELLVKLPIAVLYHDLSCSLHGGRDQGGMSANEQGNLTRLMPKQWIPRGSGGRCKRV